MAAEITAQDQTAQHYYKNSMLLEADIEEEIESLSDEIARKQNTIDHILELPKKLSYDCMVPISKVAFSPGRIIHTNEFSVQINAKTGERQWMSHIAASEYLKSEITRIEGDISQLHNYLKTRRKEGRGEGGPEKMKQRDNTDEYIPFAEEINQSPSGGRDSDSDSDQEIEEEVHQVNDKDEDDSDDSDGERAWVSTDGAGGQQGFEIREYCDKDGNVLDGQLVDLSKELSQLQTEQETKKKQSTAGGAPEGVENMLNELDEKLKLPAEGESVDLDQDAIFVRELAELSTKKGKQKQKRQHSASTTINDQGDADLDSVFSQLLQQEEDALSSQIAASKGLFSSSSFQWKKGFLSSPDKKKKTQTKASRTSPSTFQTKSKTSSSGSTPVPCNNSVESAKNTEQHVAATTEQNTIFNRTVSTLTPAVKLTDKSSQSTKEEDSSNKGDSSPQVPVVPKKVSRFKQNRAAASVASSSSSPSVSFAGKKPVAFSGQIVEK